MNVSFNDYPIQGRLNKEFINNWAHQKKKRNFYNCEFTRDHKSFLKLVLLPLPLFQIMPEFFSRLKGGKVKIGWGN